MSKFAEPTIDSAVSITIDLGVQQRVPLLVDAHATREQLVVVLARGVEDQRRVGEARHDDAHVDAALRAPRSTRDASPHRARSTLASSTGGVRRGRSRRRKCRRSSFRCDRRRWSLRPRPAPRPSARAAGSIAPSRHRRVRPRAPRCAGTASGIAPPPVLRSARACRATLPRGRYQAPVAKLDALAYVLLMLMPPVKAKRPSTTTILRWSRLLTFHGSVRVGLSGRNGSTSMPA